MFAADFLFDNNRASDFGLMIGFFDSDIETASGGEIEYNTVKTPNRDKFDLYGTQFNSVIKWEFSIIKDPYKNDDSYFTQYEERKIAQWLLKTDGYKWFQFWQDGYENICYEAKIDMTPHQVAGKTVGFDLTVTSNCGYGYSEKITKTYILNADNPIRLYINSDINNYIMPYISLDGQGDFYISNDSDLEQNINNLKPTELHNVNNIITMDSDNDIITGLSYPTDFNWHFLRLIKGVNNITTNSTNDLKIKIEYREPRRIIV